MGHKIGVFDSGVGGLTTLAEIEKLLPHEQYFYIGDHENNPYGEKTPAELTEITTEVVRKLRRFGVNMIVIACNTATTKCISDLRRRFPEITFVGTEPAIKPACDWGYHKVLLMATPNTASSQQVQKLLHNNVSQQSFTVLPCYGLAGTIEEILTPIVGPLDATRLNVEPEQLETFRQPIYNEFHTSQAMRERANAWNKIASLTELDRNPKLNAKLDELLAQVDNPESYDAVILGCTHYVHIRRIIEQRFPYAVMIDGNNGVARRVQSILTETAYI